MLIITIKQGKEKSLIDGALHVYASAVDRVDGKPGERLQSGATAVLQASSGKFLARAAFSPKSQIRARVWSFDPGEAIDHAFIKRRVAAAVAKRRGAGGTLSAVGRQSGNRQPIRLSTGEEDGLPGLLVDWHVEAPGYLICQFLSAGVDAWKIPIVQNLMKETGCANVYELSDPLMRRGEGLPDVSGALAGDTPPDGFFGQEKRPR
ncbi:MAG: SAM-dependent methyltransferase [Herminiimonas sp.]|nr:SAM-dependent methyltransferase [Herminiimonas sp.]